MGMHTFRTAGCAGFAVWMLQAASTGVVAQTANARAAYDPRVTFAPLTLPDPVNAYRSGSGAPGPSYWQNAADYEMHAELDTASKSLKNAETITYTNNSPDVLTSLWIQLDQNTYRADARSRFAGGGGRGRGAATEATSTDGFVLDSVEIEAAGRSRRPPTSCPTRACRSGWRSRSARTAGS